MKKLALCILGLSLVGCSKRVAPLAGGHYAYPNAVCMFNERTIFPSSREIVNAPLTENVLAYADRSAYCIPDTQPLLLSKGVSK